jgi:4'-phosphopantetheinyl transferase
LAAISLLALTDDVSLPEINVYLDAEQQQRLANIIHPERRRQYIAARWQAVQLLQQAGVAGDLQQSESGRPVATHWPAVDGLSWSHTQHWAVAALGRGRVGVDIETINPKRQMLNIAESYFTANEAAYLASLAIDQQPQAFYTMWVAKEALLKAMGTGLVGGLKRFEILPKEGVWQCTSPDAFSWQLQVWLLPGAAGTSLLAVASDIGQYWYFAAAGAKLLIDCGAPTL